MYVRTAGISEEVGRELVEKLEEFGLNASDNGTQLSVFREHGVEKGFAIDIPLGTILKVEYSSDDMMDKDRVDSIELELGTRSTVTFRKDGYIRIDV